MGRELQETAGSRFERVRWRVEGGRARAQAQALGAESLEIGGRLENYLGVAKGEITRLDYIVTQFLQAIRPSPACRLRHASVNVVVEETLQALLRPRSSTIAESMSRQRLPRGLA